MTFQQMVLFALPSAVAGLAVLWAAAYVMASRRTATVRHGLRLELAMPPAWALDLAAAQFAVSEWEPVAGDGTLNRQHVRPGRPAISVEAVPGESGGCEVHIWMSAWTHWRGFVRHAEVARTQMRVLADVLRAADRSYDGPVAATDGTQDVLDLLAERDESRTGRRDPNAA